MTDRRAFADALTDLHKKVLVRSHLRDYRHLRKVEYLGRGLTVVGFATACLGIHPIAILGISLGSSTRWMIAHHILHRGYDRVPGIAKRYTSRYFARGWRRYIDWFDWIHPLAWVHEHNILHHCYTGEPVDPDLVEQHVARLKSAALPRWLKYVAMFVIASVWKVIYYAPSTFSTLDPHTFKRKGVGSFRQIKPHELLRLDRVEVRLLWWHCYLPYGIWHFLVVPGGFAVAMGGQAGLFVLINRLLAEILSNLHSFMVILPNHTGPDVRRFDFHYSDRSEFFLTQILGSANYRCGHVVGDYLQFWLNYQIEHHVFSDLPILAYREIQPQLKLLCIEYGIPYHQESLFCRFRKMSEVFVGQQTMLRCKQLSDLPSVDAEKRSSGTRVVAKAILS